MYYSMHAVGLTKVAMFCLAHMTSGWMDPSRPPRSPAEPSPTGGPWIWMHFVLAFVPSFGCLSLTRALRPISGLPPTRLQIGLYPLCVFLYFVPYATC